jgi:hypothetical protein
LLPHVKGLRVQDVWRSASTIWLRVSATRQTALPAVRPPVSPGSEPLCAHRGGLAHQR